MNIMIYLKKEAEDRFAEFTEEEEREIVNRINRQKIKIVEIFSETCFRLWDTQQKSKNKVSKSF